MINTNTLETTESCDLELSILELSLTDLATTSNRNENAVDAVMSLWALPKRFTPVLESTLYDPKLERRNYGI